MRIFALALSSLLPFAAGAETPMTGKEFAANVTGWTITYTYLGEIYKVVQYLPDHKMRHAFEDETGKAICFYSIWYQDGDDICTDEDDGLDPDCWQYTLRSGVIEGWEAGVANHTIIETHRSPTPIICAEEDK